MNKVQNLTKILSNEFTEDLEHKLMGKEEVLNFYKRLQVLQTQYYEIFEFSFLILQQQRVFHIQKIILNVAKRAQLSFQPFLAWYYSCRTLFSILLAHSLSFCASLSCFCSFLNFPNSCHLILILKVCKKVFIQHHYEIHFRA